MVNFGQAAVGLILLLIVVGGLLYIFYSRTNAIEKTGYGSLIMLTLVSLMIPVFWIMESGNQASAQVQLHTLAVQRGLLLYAQYCTTGCYAIQNGKIVNAMYNGYTVDALNQISDDDLRRIVSAGIYNPAAPPPANANAIPRSDQYGGALLSNDVEYLFQFIRSADPQYLRKNGFDPNGNGFDQLPDYLQNNFTALYQAAVSLGSAGQFGTATDMTKQKAITINIVQPPPGATCRTSCFEVLNAKVKVGTVITWINKTQIPHTVTAIQGKNTAAPAPAADIFDSGTANLIGSNGKFTYTVTQAAYNANPDHVLIYYCRIHPDMLAELTIVP
ncbi:MAG TPA: hypothetical protein VFU49_07595 [Ktedonobacteraceae bacterium]|nr:hypothetical protein [Ktedonobacteraceae bacterium]